MLVYFLSEVKKCIGEYMAKRKAQTRYKSSNAYIPKCNRDGSYQPTQCHETIGFNFCWCVDVNTGKPIPNTTRKVTSLDCSSNGKKTNGARVVDAIIV